MMYHCVLGLVAVYWLNLYIFVKSVVTPICMPWDTTGSYLTVKCIVFDAKHDILIVDPFGKNRGQCVLGDSPDCSKRYKYDLISVENFQRFTTVILRTLKHNADGKWKCRSGKKEQISQVSYAAGTVPNINIEISGKIERNNGRTRFILTCFSCWKPLVEGVDIYVNNVLEDSIRYHEDLCYHKQNQCRPERCSCSAKGNYFTWTFISDLSYINFTCSMRFEYGIESKEIIRKADLVYNGSAFIHRQTTPMSIFNTTKNLHNLTIDADNEQTKETGVFGYVILGTLGTMIFGITIICFVRMRAKRKKNETLKKQGDEEDQIGHESVPLLGEVEDKIEQESVPILGEVEDKIEQESVPLLGTDMLSGSNFRIKDVKVACLCSNSPKELRYTIQLMTDFQTLGFQPENISLISGAFPDNFFSKTLTTVLKLIIVIPEKNQLDLDNFMLQVEMAGKQVKGSPVGSIITIVRSDEASLPLWVTEMNYFQRFGSQLKDALLCGPKATQMDGLRNSLNTYQNRLNEIQFDRETCKHFTNLGLTVLKGWGLEVDQERLIFRLDILESVSRYEPICVKDFVESFVSKTSISCLKLYYCKRIDFGDIPLNLHVHKQIMKIFKIFFGTRLNFLNENSTMSYQRFSTYASRFLSFTNYPIRDKSFWEKLAFAGFFYFDLSDYVQCFHCKGCVHNLNISDNPLVIHRRHFKKCQYVNNLTR